MTAQANGRARLPGPAPEGRWDPGAWWSLILAAVAFFHAAFYALGNPVYEAPDEPAHLEYVNFVAANLSLPVQMLGERPVRHAHQFPLYYLGAGAVLRLAGGPVRVQLQARPPVAARPIFRHLAPAFPTARDARAFYLLRLLNALLCGLAVWQVARAARALWPRGLGWIGAPLLLAGLPQFAFIGGSVSNEPLTALLGAACAHAAVRLAVGTASPGAWCALGIWIGLAGLAKKSALAFAPALPVLAAALWLARRRGGAAWLKGAALGLATAALVFAPLLVRNLALYGEPLLNDLEVETLPEFVSFHTWDSPHFTETIPRMASRSYVGQFGWMNVALPDLVVQPILFLCGVGLALSLALFGMRREAPAAAFFWAALAANVAGLLYYNLTFAQPQGRLLFPTVACAALLAGGGLRLLLRPLPVRAKRLLAASGALYLFLAAWTAYDVNASFYEVARRADLEELRGYMRL